MTRSQIEQILPEKKKESYYHGDVILGVEHNQCRDDVIAALLKSDLCKVPSVYELSELILLHGNKPGLATAIRGLMMKEG